jgi:hypothetical protein
LTCRALSVNHLSSSSRLVRPGGVRWGWALSKELLRSSVAQGLVGADGVVGPLPLLPLLIELGDLERAGGDLLKLLRVGAVSALDVAIEFGGARRNNEHRQSALSTRLFEGGIAFTAPIDLHCPQGERQARLQGVEVWNAPRQSAARAATGAFQASSVPTLGLQAEAVPCNLFRAPSSNREGEYQPEL